MTLQKYKVDRIFMWFDYSQVQIEKRYEEQNVLVVRNLFNISSLNGF